MTKPKDVIKYCPKCGSHQFIFDGSKSFKCQKCHFHFFINSACAVAAIIVNEQGNILLTHRAFDPCAGMLDLPGGFVDPMETAEGSVIREIKEELNLDVTSLTYFMSYPNEYVFSDYTVFTTDLGFICEVASIDNIIVKDDVSDYEFKAEAEIQFDEISSESIRQIVKGYFKHVKQRNLD